MEKPKIVIICGNEPRLTGGFVERFLEMGKNVFDIEVVDVNDTLIGNRPDIMVWDEQSDVDLKSMDFSSLEERVAKHQSWFYDNMPKDPAERQRWKDETFCLRYGSTRKLGMHPAFAYPYGQPKEKPANRRKGPKGPRGKWGKLK